MKTLKYFKNKFTEHPNKIGETYFEHFKYASGVSKTMAQISCLIMIHAIFPFKCEHSASEKLNKLNEELQKRKEECKDGKA